MRFENVRMRSRFSKVTFVKSYDRFLVIVFIVILHVFSLALTRHFRKTIRDQISESLLQQNCRRLSAMIEEELPVRCSRCMLRLRASNLIIYRKTQIFCIPDSCVCLCLRLDLRSRIDVSYQQVITRYTQYAVISTLNTLFKK